MVYKYARSRGHNSEHLKDKVPGGRGQLSPMPSLEVSGDARERAKHAISTSPDKSMRRV